MTSWIIPQCDQPTQARQPLHYLMPETPIDALGDLRLEDEGLTYVLSIVECRGPVEPAGGWVAAKNADVTLLIAMLRAARGGIKRLSDHIRFSRPCGKVSGLAARQMAASVRKFVEQLRNRTGSNNGFVMVWHIKGQPCVHVDHSRNLRPEQVAEVIHGIAVEVVDDQFWPV